MCAACAQWRRSRREGELKLDGCWAPAWRRCSLRICPQHTQALKKALGAETRVGSMLSQHRHTGGAAVTWRSCTRREGAAGTAHGTAAGGPCRGKEAHV